MKGALIVALGISVFTDALAQAPTSPKPPADEDERSCVLASGNRVRMALKIEPTAGRIRKLKPDEPGIPEDYRHVLFYEVEVDAMNTGLTVTYVFWCMSLGEKWHVFPQGRRGER